MKHWLIPQNNWHICHLNWQFFFHSLCILDCTSKNYASVSYPFHFVALGHFVHSDFTYCRTRHGFVLRDLFHNCLFSGQYTTAVWQVKWWTLEETWHIAYPENKRNNEIAHQHRRGMTKGQSAFATFNAFHSFY